MAGPSSTMLHPEPRPESTDITNSAFYSIEAIQNLVPSDLSNDIHPIFRPENFPAADLDYTKVETSLRLASHFVELALPIFYSIALCTPESWPSGTPGEYIGVLPGPGELTPKQKADTRAMLLSMAEVVTFEISSEADEDHAGAVAMPGEDCTSGAVPGGHSAILISPEWYTDISECSSDDPVRSFWFSFRLASTLYHELVHAAEHASSWAQGRGHDFQDGKVFIGESYTDELGYEAEAWLFGGIVQLVEVDKTFYTNNGTMTSLQGLICRFDWPMAEIVEEYIKEARKKVEPGAKQCASIYVRGSPYLGDIHCLWNVSFLSIANMFYDSFWQEQETNLTGFPFKTSTGYRFDRTKAKGPLTGSVGLEDEVSRVPDGFELGEYGILQRWKDGKPASRLSRKTAKLINAFKAIPLGSAKERVPRRYRL